MVLKQGKLFDNRSIDDRFEEFLRDHPDVWDLFCRFAWELKLSGKERGSADAILHRIHRFSSRFARAMIEKCPAFVDFFETRKLKSD